jgi:uncharacterized Fe-S cluster-containing protein
LIQVLFIGVNKKEMAGLKEILDMLPGKDCGLCGFKTCEEFAQEVMKAPEALKKCVYHQEKAQLPEIAGLSEQEINWKDILERDYDFILDKFPDDPGPRETILLANPANVEKLRIKKGDILYGRPAIGTGCPVTHCGVVMEEPDYFNGTVVWCIVGPILPRERGIHIGYYYIVAYEGLVTYMKKELEFGRRYFFLPRYCMLQSRHSGLINTIGKVKNGFHVRLEGIWLG